MQIADASRARVEEALATTAGLFPAAARDTILYENRFKHTYEIQSIIAAADDLPGGVCDLGGGLGVNLICLRVLGFAGRLVLIDQFDEYDEHNRMGSWTDAVQLLHEHDIEVVRQNFWTDPKLPFPDGTFAVATCLDVVEHLPGHPLRQLRELRRALAVGGTCMLSAPNAVSLTKRIQIVSGRYPYSPIDLWLTDPYYEHYREYTRAEYEELLRRAGFENVRSSASAAVTRCRARHRYHRGRLSALSPRIPLLWGLAACETLVPSVRHTVYAFGTAAG